MKSGMMFGELKKYLDEDFYNAHKTIEFNTLYERRSMKSLKWDYRRSSIRMKMYSGIIIF